MHSTEAFHLKLEIHQIVPPRVSNLNRDNESRTNGDGFCSDWEFLLKLRAGFLVINTFKGLDTKSANMFSLWLMYRKEVMQISDNLLQIWTSGGINKVEFR